MKKDTIAPDRVNAGYDETYQDWLKNNIQGISFSVSNNYRGVEDKQAKVVIELRQVKKEAKEMQDKFLQKQCVIQNTTQVVESLKHNLEELD